MPYYRRRRTYWRRPRRHFWRFRPTFWRNRRWRKRRRVRKKRLSIKLKQYQPETIHKSTIKGLQPITITNGKRLTNNYRQYEHSIIPEHQPGGGGFSITKITLDALYEQHQLVRNWWTKPNTNLPLCRYTGAKLKLYRSDDVDYVFTPFTCYPMTATQGLYTSCQPSIQLMNPHSIKVPSKKTKPRGRPYKIVKLHPPAQLTNKWYFTKDLSNAGLFMYTAAVCSLDHYYINSYSESNNISFTSLNPKFFTRHNFEEPGQDGYIPWVQGTQHKLIFATIQATTTENVATIQTNSLIYLGNSKMNQMGRTVQQSGKNTLQEYLKPENKNLWGNIFYKGHLTEGDYRILVSTKKISELQQKYTTNQNLEAGDFTFATEPLTYRCRYQPDVDTGKDNQMYILSNVREITGWDPPNSENVKIYGFPMWLLVFGWLDFMKKAGVVVHIDEHYVMAFKSKFIQPQLDYYIPLDQDFLDNKSPYETQNDSVNAYDMTHWYPQVSFQHQTIEAFGSTGPGIAKLAPKKSVETKMEYKLYFKWGGCPPKMDKITDPSELPKFPIPNNDDGIYSFQNPNMSPEYYLYNFDFRKDFLTSTAAQRITRHKETQKSLFSTTGKQQPAAQLVQETTETSSEGEETSQEEEETLLQRLRLLQRKKQQLQLKLLQLMGQ
nr:MAG: ORF1 [TTV-like mini virus]